MEAVRYVDVVVPEQTWEDKALYIDMFDVDIFAMGDGWRGKFDSLKDDFPNLKVMYFPRGQTSSSQLKSDIAEHYKAGSE
jgi:glycerol-3-phosphate cytidylyltransferase